MYPFCWEHNNQSIFIRANSISIYLMSPSYTTFITQSEESLFYQSKGWFHHHLLSHPIRTSNPTVYTPTPLKDTFLPLLTGKIIISQFSSYQTVYTLILHNHHSLHLSPHQKIKYPPQSKSVISSSVVIPLHQKILLYLIVGKNNYQ